MAYAVGDVVVIRPDLLAGEDYNNVGFVSEMDEYKLCEATITRIILRPLEVARQSPRFHIDIDGGEFIWTSAMFCGTKEEYEQRNDWGKPFFLEMLDNLVDDIEVCVSVPAKEDARILWAALSERGYLRAAFHEPIDVNADEWDDDREDTVYWLTKSTVDRTDKATAEEDDWDYVIKYTFQSVRLDDFELPDGDLLLV